MAVTYTLVSYQNLDGTRIGNIGEPGNNNIHARVLIDATVARAANEVVYILDSTSTFDENWAPQLMHFGGDDSISTAPLAHVGLYAQVQDQFITVDQEYLASGLSLGNATYGLASMPIVTRGRRLYDGLEARSFAHVSNRQYWIGIMLADATLATGIGTVHLSIQGSSQGIGQPISSNNGA
jgi:hypothetical protein